jgi:hypothetical protein
MKRLIGITAIAIALNCSAVLSGQAYTLNTTPLNTLGQPVGNQPVITGALPRNTTISSSINPGASSIVATTLQIHPNYTPPVRTTPANTFGRPVSVISSSSAFSSLPKISPVAIGAPTIRIPVATVGSFGSYGDGATPGPGGSAGYPDNGGAVSSSTGWSGFSSWFTPSFASRGFVRGLVTWQPLMPSPRGEQSQRGFVLPVAKSSPACLSNSFASNAVKSDLHFRYWHESDQPRGSHSLDPAWPYSSARLQSREACATGSSVGIRSALGPKRTLGPPQSQTPCSD